MRIRSFDNLEKNGLAILLAAMGLCMLAAACCRHLYPALHPFALRAAAGCLTWLASLGMARAAALGLHTRVSFIEDFVSPAAKRRLNEIADVGFLVFAAFSFAVGCVALRGGLAPPHAAERPFVLAAIPVGSLLAIIRLVQRIRKRRREEAAP